MDEMPAGAGAPAEKKGRLSFGKVVAGCLVVLLLVCGTGGYFGLKFLGYAKDVDAAIREVQGVEGTEVARLLDRAKEAAPFDEPETPSTTAERLAVFLATRLAVYPSGEVAQEAQGVFKQDADLGFIEAAEQTLAACEIWAKTRKEFAAALVSAGMSEEEYVYLHRLVFHSGIVKGAILDGAGNVIELAGLEAIPEETKRIVKGFEERIQAKPSGRVDGLLMGLNAKEIAVASGPARSG